MAKKNTKAGSGSKARALSGAHKMGKHQSPQPVHTAAVGSPGRDPDNFIPTPGSLSLEELREEKLRHRR